MQYRVGEQAKRSTHLWCIQLVYNQQRPVVIGQSFVHVGGNPGLVTSDSYTQMKNEASYEATS